MAADKLALVIGNSEYESQTRLPCAHNDANDMAVCLEELGFDIEPVALNSKHGELKERILGFIEKFDKSKTALFYYSGHGMQVKGDNYLVPVDYGTNPEKPVLETCYNLKSMFDAMAANDANTNIVILDSCRSDPLSKSLGESGAAGFGAMPNNSKGTIIAYATSQGACAYEDGERNGRYTGVLLKYIRTPNLKIEDLFKQVRCEVIETYKKTIQMSNESTSLIGDFYFNPQFKQEPAVAFEKPDIVTIGYAPRKPAHFVGREKEIESIKEHIKSGSEIVLVSGMGGIGKSTICKVLFDNYKKEGDAKIKHIGWAEWKGGLKATFFKLFKETANIDDIDESFLRAKTRINKLGSDLLLFVDGMDDPDKEDKAALNELTCNIIISSRLDKIAGFRTVPVGRFPLEKCVEIYMENRDAKNIDGSKKALDHDVISEIVNKADCVTVVVELLANTASSAMLSDSELLKKLETNGFDLSDISETVFDDKTFNENMQALFNVSKVTEEERNALKMLSIFPSSPLHRDKAKKWLKLENLNALNALAGKGWLTKTDETFQMHDVISGVVKYDNAPTYEECADLIDMLAEDLNYGSTKIFTSWLGILPFGQSVAARFSGVEKENVASLLSNIARLCDAQGEYGKALEYNARALTIREEVLGLEHPSTAASCNNMAEVFRAQGEHGKALEYNARALAICEKVLGLEHPTPRRATTTWP